MLILLIAGFLFFRLADVDFNFAGPTLNGAVVLGHSGVFAGIVPRMKECVLLS